MSYFSFKACHLIIQLAGKPTAAKKVCVTSLCACRWHCKQWAHRHCFLRLHENQHFWSWFSKICWKFVMDAHSVLKTCLSAALDCHNDVWPLVTIFWSCMARGGASFLRMALRPALLGNGPNFTLNSSFLFYGADCISETGISGSTM